MNMTSSWMNTSMCSQKMGAIELGNSVDWLKKKKFRLRILNTFLGRSGDWLKMRKCFLPNDFSYHLAEEMCWVREGTDGSETIRWLVGCCCCCYCYSKQPTSCLPARRGCSSASASVHERQCPLSEKCNYLFWEITRKRATVQILSRKIHY